MIKITVIGAKGKMGRALIECANADSELEIVSKIDVGDDLHSGMKVADVAVDFSFHEVTEKVLDIAFQLEKPLVIGTTNLSNETFSKIYKVYSKRIPIVFAPNFSIGVQVLFSLVKKAAEMLPNFDLEVVEMHHRQKKDAPSGTAKKLIEILQDAKKPIESPLIHGREGSFILRKDDEIGVHSLRGGDVFGDHKVVFAAEGERLELTHRASSRSTFAKGALHSAKWIVNKKPNLYSFLDVLNLKID